MFLEWSGSQSLTIPNPRVSPPGVHGVWTCQKILQPRRGCTVGMWSVCDAFDGLIMYALIFLTTT